MINNDWLLIKHFKKSEFACPCCKKVNIDYKFVKMLDKARTYSDIPFVLSSGCRCEAHNINKKGSKTSSHLFDSTKKTKGCDIRYYNGHQRAVIAFALWRSGFKRLLIYPNHIHVDIKNNTRVLEWCEYAK